MLSVVDNREIMHGFIYVQWNRKTPRLVNSGTESKQHSTAAFGTICQVLGRVGVEFKGTPTPGNQ